MTKQNINITVDFEIITEWRMRGIQRSKVINDFMHEHIRLLDGKEQKGRKTPSHLQEELVAAKSSLLTALKEIKQLKHTVEKSRGREPVPFPTDLPRVTYRR